eukprot:4209144-Pleurochrysis_carterae.AAC.2
MRRPVVHLKHVRGLSAVWRNTLRAIWHVSCCTDDGFLPPFPLYAGKCAHGPRSSPERLNATRKAVSCTPRRGGGRRKLSLCLLVRVALLSERRRGARAQRVAP